MQNESYHGAFASAAVGLFLAAVAAVFFCLLGMPLAAETPYIAAVCTTCAALFVGSIWIGATRTRTPVRGVFVVIGSSIVVAVVLFDCTLTLAYRQYLHLVLTVGGLYAILVLANGLCVLLVAALPMYSRFAGGLSATDAHASGERSDLTEELLGVEERFFAVCVKLGKRYSDSDRFPITVLREKAGVLTPALQAPSNTLLDADASVREHVAQVAAIVDEAAAIDPNATNGWMRRIEESCSAAIRAMERRERLIVRQQNGAFAG